MKIRFLGATSLLDRTTETPSFYQLRAEGELECSFAERILKIIPKGKIDIGNGQRLELGESKSTGKGPDQEISVEVKIYPAPMRLP